jgi:cytoskeleton protein RodZ
MSVGKELRAARESKGLSIDKLSERTRVQPRALAAIELDDLSAIPPRPFGRGFVHAYAAEVGLEADRVVREYFAQFPPTHEPTPAPPSLLRSEPEQFFELSSQWTGLAAAAGILILVVAAAFVLGRRGDSPAEHDAVGTSGAAAPAPTAADARAHPAPAAAKPAEPAASTMAAKPQPESKSLTLAFTVTRPCWVTASVDGQRTIYRIVDAGQHETLTAEREIQIRFGDAEAVSWKINGRDGGRLGAASAVRDLRITPENVATIH